MVSLNGCTQLTLYHVTLVFTHFKGNFDASLKGFVKAKYIWQFDVFSTVHHSIELLHQPTLMHNFLYSFTICLLHYYPRHVSSINMPIFRRKNCIHTASGIFTLCKRLLSTLVESGLQSTLNQCTNLNHIEHHLFGASNHYWRRCFWHQFWCLTSSDAYPLTCPAREALPVATLLLV